jgi:hypothetical protein
VNTVTVLLFRSRPRVRWNEPLHPNAAHSSAG